MPHRRMPTVGVPSADADGGMPTVGVPSVDAPTVDAIGGCPRWVSHQRVRRCVSARRMRIGECRRWVSHRRMPVGGCPTVGVPSADALGGCPSVGASRWLSHRRMPSADADGGCPLSGCHRRMPHRRMPTVGVPSADAISGCPPLGGCTSADASAVGVPSCGGGWMSPPRRTLGRSRGSSLGVESARYCASLLRLVYTRSTKPSDCNSGP